jgi:DeoR family transcriptional regulator, aga operon transcriptional repressor
MSWIEAGHDASGRSGSARGGLNGMRAAPRSRLLVEERRRRIMDVLKTQARVTVSELAGRFHISAVTIRADLRALGQAGALVRAHGGAVPLGDEDSDLPLAVKKSLRHAEKLRIGERAAQEIGPDETIILDSGTTTGEIARVLRRLSIPGLTVVTNALNVAVELANTPRVRVMMLGGVLRPPSRSFVGPEAERTLAEVQADRLFLGVDGFDLQGGLTTPDPLEAFLNGMMIAVSREVVVVADSTKFGRRSLSRIAAVDAVRRVVTDKGIDRRMAAAIAERGIEVITV